MVIDKFGNKKWFKNGRLHNENGPAMERIDGYKVWCINGDLHRTDGPAVEYSSGLKIWYLNKRQLTEQEWLSKVLFDKVYIEIV